MLIARKNWLFGDAVASTDARTIDLRQQCRTVALTLSAMNDLLRKIVDVDLADLLLLHRHCCTSPPFREPTYRSHK